MKIAIDCDDAADELKAVIFQHLQDQGLDITDLAFGKTKQNPFYPEKQIRRIMNRLADPTDRPFNSTSSPDNSYAIKDTHAAAASGDQAYITARNLYVRWSMHMDYYPVVGG